MSGSARISSLLRYLALAALAALVTGCASTPPPTASAAGSPASTAELRELGDFTKKAQEEGWTTQVRDGQVLYCMDEAPMGSRLSRRTCLNKARLEQVMLAEQRQREAMQTGPAYGCRPPPAAC
jgi:hypothetical protein